MTLLLAVTGVVHLLVAASFVYVARTLASAHEAGDSELAQRAFAAWWGGLAVVVAGWGLLDLAAVAGHVSIPVTKAEWFVEIAAIGFAAWGIAFYVLFLYTGKRALAPIAGVYFAAVCVAYAVLAFRYEPTGIDVTDWGVHLRPATPGISIILALVGVPLILATLAYMSLYPRLTTRAQRYRLALVSTSLALWVGGGLAGNLGSDPFYQFASVTGLGALTAAAVLLAYRPPRRLHAWLEPDSPEGRDRRAERVQTQEALRERLGQLV